MNKYKKSLERVKKNTDTKDWSEEDWEHYQTICDALDKQIPKKPYFRAEETTAGYACPVCDMGVTVDNGRIRETYCSHCGQVLDWGDTK